MIRRLYVVILVITLLMNIASADPESSSLHEDPVYRNITKSFQLRGAVDPQHIQFSKLKDLQNEMINILTQVYLYSQTKNQKKNLYIPNQDDFIYKHRILSNLQASFNRAHYKIRQESLFKFEDANSVALKMVYITMRTINEFSPYLPFREKYLRDLLVKEFSDITNDLFNVHYARDMASFKRPYLNPAMEEVDELYRSLTPPNFFSRLNRYLKGDKSRAFVPRIETRQTCASLFK